MYMYQVLTFKLCGVNFDMVDCIMRRASKVEENGSSLSSSIVMVMRPKIFGRSEIRAKDSYKNKDSTN